MFRHILKKRLVLGMTVLTLVVVMNGIVAIDAQCRWKPINLSFPIYVWGQHPTRGCKHLLCRRESNLLRPFIDTLNDIHLFQSFDYRIKDPVTVAQYYDFVWGVTPRKVPLFREGHPEIVVSYYIPFHRDWGSFKEPEDWAEHNLSYWRHLHPDWILYRCDRVTPAYEYGKRNMPLDFSNPDVVAWQVQMYGEPASRSGYDAIAADNLNLDNMFGACGFYRHGRWVQRYSGARKDPQWRADVISWVSRMYTSLHSLAHPLALIPNFDLGGGLQSGDPSVLEIVNNVDAILDERGFTNYGGNYVTGNDWLQMVQFIQNVQEQNKAYYILNKVNRRLRVSQIHYVLASYLMCKGRHASVFINGDENYGRDIRHSEYDAPIGSPQGDMYFAQHVYWRRYSGGMVVVNPSQSTAYTVRIPSSSYHDISGHGVRSRITIAPHSGMVLIQN